MKSFSFPLYCFFLPTDHAWGCQIGKVLVVSAALPAATIDVIKKFSS